MFGKFFQKIGIGDAVNRFGGQTDFLEAVCAATALVAAADGEIEPEEVEEVLKQVSNHPQLSAAFNSAQIERTANTMLSRAGSGFTGRAGLMKEIEDVASDAQKAETVLLVAIDIAHADGELEPAERKVLETIAKKLRLDLNRILEG